MWFHTGRRQLVFSFRNDSRTLPVLKTPASDRTKSFEDVSQVVPSTPLLEITLSAIVVYEVQWCAAKVNFGVSWVQARPCKCRLDSMEIGQLDCNCSTDFGIVSHTALGH
jgi:hypothetical protein